MLQLNFKSALVAAALLCPLCQLSAQSSSQKNSGYWAFGEKIIVEEDKSTAILLFQDRSAAREQASLRSINSGISQELVDENIILELENSSEIGTTQDLENLVSNPENLKHVSFGWKIPGGAIFYPTETVLLELKSGHSISELSSILEDHSAKFTKTEFETIYLKVSDLDQVLPLCNAIHESGISVWSQPDFIHEINFNSIPNDPLFSHQFQMHQANDIDINAPEAWALTKGDHSVKVAVYDDGVDPHPDLPNLDTTLGFDVGGGKGYPSTLDQAHGIACAGIIGASHNGKGVAGVAPNAKMFSVRATKESSNIYASSADLATGFFHAMENGAAIINCSWGGKYQSRTMPAIHNALTSVTQNGRGGLGCIVIASAGNDSKQMLRSPANHPMVLSVGAVDRNGLKSWYSNKSVSLDVCAPSSNAIKNVYTTDRTGANGKNKNGDYRTNFSGTSAAAPAVSGVAALMLAVNPSLTRRQVYLILKSTAKDLGVAGFDYSFGHGLVKADEAVKAAQQLVDGGNIDGDDDNTPNPDETNPDETNPDETNPDEKCVVGNVKMEIKTDNYGYETFWTLKQEGYIIKSIKKDKLLNKKLHNWEWKLEPGQYTLTIHDSHKDGIKSPGYVKIDLANKGIITIPKFEVSHSVKFCVGSNDISHQSLSGETLLKTQEQVIFPNPAFSYIEIRTSLENATTLVVTDLTGRKVKSINFKTNYQRIDISDLDNGTYQLSIYSEDKMLSTAKFVKTN